MVECEGNKRYVCQEIPEVPPYFRSNDRYGERTFFVYRSIDVLRIVAVAKAVARGGRPRIVDVGCSNGDFTKRFLNYPDVEIVGIDRNPRFPPASWRRTVSVEDIVGERFDLAFVGWMALGADYRKPVSKLADVIVTAFDSGGSCGVDGDVGYSDFGFERVASWCSPLYSSIDLVSNRIWRPLIMSGGLGDANDWEVYARPAKAALVRCALRSACEVESRSKPYDYESWLDVVSFGIGGGGEFDLWNVKFEDEPVVPNPPRHVRIAP